MRWLFLFSTLFIKGLLLSQSLIINEVSQGATGAQEYVELLVLPGNTVYTCNNYCIDIRGWIIDDNNGYFSGGVTSGTGVAAGAVRFPNSAFWSCIPVGTLIVIYNSQDPNADLPADDFSTTDGNCRLVIPVSSNLLEFQEVSPNTTSSSYPTTGWTLGGSPWSPLGMSNSNDSFQIYTSSSFTVPSHGVSWGNNNSSNIIYFPGSASNTVHFFANTVDNDPMNQANWTAGTCSAPNQQTPGAPNNAANATYINSLTNSCAGPLQIATPTVVDASCGCNGSFSLSVSGSIPSYTYIWTDSNNNPINNNSASLVGVCAGTYNCTVVSSIGCTSSISATVQTSTTQVTPVFSAIGPFCQNDVAPSLPTSSNNNITGTWSPALISTTTIGTTTYTFTPDDLNCSTTAQIQITVNNGTSPQFANLPTQYCNGATVGNLPTTSDNNISGTWNPTTVNTAQNGNYTAIFTPSSGSCQTTYTYNFSVVDPITPTFTQWGPFCENSVLAQVILPTTSNEGITGTWNPAMVATAPSGNAVHTFTPGNGQCAQTTTMTVTINPSTTPTFPIFGSMCVGDPAVTLPTTSNNGATGTWNPTQITTTGTGIFTYDFTPSNTNACYNPVSVSVLINTAIAPPINNQTVCSGNPVTLFAAGSANYQWSDGVQNGVPFIPTSTTVYTLTTSENGCTVQSQVTVTVNPSPTITVIPDVTLGIAPLTVNFTNNSSNANVFDWDFGNGQSALLNTTQSQTMTYTTDGSYQVQVIASNGTCSTDTIITISVVPFADPVIEFPNVFTPNGDGSNESYFPTVNFAKDIDYIIVNRWGNVIATLSGLTASWDGKSGNSDCSDGVYFYKYTATKLNDTKVEGHGFFHLIR